MRCIIIDDEPLAREELEYMLDSYAELEVLGSFSGVGAAQAFLEQNQVDLLFLDIHMPGLSGLEFAQMVRHNYLIIFTTAYSEHALKGYELDVVDYLLKPIESERLSQGVAKASFFLQLLQAAKAGGAAGLESSAGPEGQQDYLLVRSERQHIKVLFSDIFYIQGLKDYVIIHLKDQKIITAMNLKGIHARLPGNQFFRVSKSFIVQKELVERFDSRSIYILGQDIPVGQKYKKAFLQAWDLDLG